jgi:hypothetical protein
MREPTPRLRWTIAQIHLAEDVTRGYPRLNREEQAAEFNRLAGPDNQVEPVAFEEKCSEMGFPGES